MALAQWRPLVLASAVTAALAGAVVAQTCLGGSDSPPSTPDITPQVTAEAPSPTATTVPLPEPDIIEVESPLERRVFEAGEAVDLTNAVGFLSAESGALETWAADDATDGYVDAARDGGLLLYSGGGSNQYTLIERATGTAYRLGTGVRPLIETAHGTLLIVAVPHDGRFETAILDVRTQTFRPLGVPGTADGAILGHAAADGRRAVIHAGATVAVVDMVANTAIAVGTNYAIGDYSVEVLPGGLGFRVANLEEPEEASWFGWDGEAVTEMAPPGEPSQNGRYFAEEGSFGRIRNSIGMGGLPALNYITVHDRTNASDVIRLLGASLLRGRASWSASGDTLLVEVPTGYQLVTLDGRVTSTIDDPEHWLYPEPSPVINGLLGTRQGTIINTARGTTVEPIYHEDAVLSSRWSDRPGELIVHISTGGKGRDWPIQLLPFETRTPPFDEAPKVLAAEGECLVVFDDVGPDAGEVGCVDAGTAGTITEVDDPLFEAERDKEGPFPVVGAQGSDRVVWLHVEFEDGTTGWADVSGLAWAE